MSSYPRFLTFPPEPVERRSPGTRKNHENTGDEQHAIQMTRVPTLCRNLDPQRRHKHLHAEQRPEHTGSDTEYEQDAAHQLQDGDKWGHESRERNRNPREECSHATDPTRELLVPVNRK